MGRGTADKCHWSVWGALAVFPPHWVCPRSRPVCFPRLHWSGSRLLYRERALSCMHFPGLSGSVSGSWVLHNGADSVGPEFCAFPRQLRWPGAWWAHSSWVRCTLSPLRSQPQFPHAPVGCSLCLFWGADLWLRPSQSMSTIQNLRKSLVRIWKPVCSLLGDAISGAEFAPFPSPVPPASPAGDGPVHSWLALLWYSLSPLFWEWAGSALG